MNNEARYLHLRNKILKNQSIISKCEKCNGTGFVPTGNIIAGDIEFKDCSCRERYEFIKRLILANFPRRRYKKIVKQKKKIQAKNMLTNKKVNVLNKVIKPYTENFKDAKKKGMGLIFFGPSGTGKTTSALIILRYVIEKYNLDCYYINFKSLIDLLLSSYDNKELSPLYNEIISVDLLVVDELSMVGRVTNHMIAEFTSLCKNRFENEQPTILISNYQSQDEIYNNFGQPLQSLTNEAFALFKFIGKDLREDKYEHLKEFFE